MSRVERDRQIAAMRASGMQVEQIATACGVSGRTVARILSRQGPSNSDVHIVRQYDEEAETAAQARQNEQKSTLRAMGVKLRMPLSELRSGDDSRPVRCLYTASG